MSTESMPVRVALPVDAALVARQRAQMFMEMGKLPESEQAAFEQRVTPCLRTHLEQGTYRGWFVLGPEGEVAGGGVLLRPLLPRPDNPYSTEAIVLNVYVEPPFRRRGAARTLMRAVLGWCQSQGIGRVVLHPSPAGLPLYQSLGFVPTGELVYRGGFDLPPPGDAGGAEP